MSIESFQVYFGVYGWFLFKKDTKVEYHEDTIKKKIRTGFILLFRNENTLFMLTWNF